MNIREEHQKIIDGIVRRAQRVCPGSLAMIGVYGSVLTGDIHEKSDLDLMLLIRDDAGWKLSAGFLLGDVGYDLYCTTWEALEEDARCGHAQLSKLMDSQLVYVEEPADLARLEALRETVRRTLAGEERFEKARNALKRAKVSYADAMLAQTLGEARCFGAEVILGLLGMVMLENGRYFRLGAKRTFEELAELRLPEAFQSRILRAVQAETKEELQETLTQLLGAAEVFLQKPKNRQAPSQENLRGTYEEMVSNWRHKMVAAEARGDVYASFMNLAALQSMCTWITDHVAVELPNPMGKFTPADLGENRRLFDGVLEAHLRGYEQAGMTPVRYGGVDAFLADYLGE